MKYKFKSEEELAEKIVTWLKENGWVVYQEVQIMSYDRIADIVAVKDDKTWVIETKLNFGFTVLEQADAWLNWANYVSIGIPYKNSKHFKDRVAELLGLGVLCVSKDFYREKFLIKQRVLAKENKEPYKYLKERLNNYQKDFAKAGNSNGKRYTPYSHTVKQLEDLAEKEPGIQLRDAIQKIQHHYRSDKNAICSIAQWIHRGSITSLRLEKEKGINRLYLVEDKK